MRMTEAETKLRRAAVRAFLAGHPVNSLMQLESYDGPACGAAGGIVRKWPAEGVLEHRPEKVYRLRYVRNGHRSEIHVEQTDGGAF